MEDKVFFDTNIITSELGTKNFLGGRSQLNRFQRVSEIIIPKIVFDELVQQKKKNLLQKRDSFKSNPFFEIHGLSMEKLTDESIEEHLEKMRDTEQIKFTIVSLQDENILKDISELATNCIAPFDQNTDKGFKDSLIYFTILQYAAKYPDAHIYLISRDLRLCEAFKKHPKIRVFSDYDEYEKNQGDYFLTEYFVGRLRTELDDKTITAKSVVSIKLSDDLIWKLKVETLEFAFDLEIDYASREVVSIKASPIAQPSESKHTI